MRGLTHLYIPKVPPLSSILHMLQLERTRIHEHRPYNSANSKSRTYIPIPLIVIRMRLCAFVASANDICSYVPWRLLSNIISNSHKTMPWHRGGSCAVCSTVWGYISAEIFRTFIGVLDPCHGIDRVLALRLYERPELSHELTINMQPQVEFA